MCNPANSWKHWPQLAEARQAEEAVRDAKAVIYYVRRVYNLPGDIFVKKQCSHTRKLSALPEEVSRLAKTLAKRVEEVAALAKEVDALAGDVDKLPDEISGLTDDADSLAEETARHTDNKLTRPQGQQNPNDLAYVYRLAVNKSVNEAGLDLWVKDEKSPAFEPNRRFLWLTRRLVPTQDLSEEKLQQQFDNETELYLYGKHQPVDTCMSSLRQLASTAERARLIASVRHGAGNVSSPRLPTSIVSEIALHRFRWNFMRRRREKKKDRRGNRGNINWE